LKETILITGAAGFIGFHLAQRVLNSGQFTVIGLDNINDYYDPNLKEARIEELKKSDDFTFIKLNLENAAVVMQVFEQYKPTYAINLAAQAGVRYSLENPQVYIDTNITGFLNILEACRKHPVKHLLFASSSSVYGMNQQEVFSEDMHTEHPMSLYASTKKCNEMMAHSYASLFKIPVTGLRFFSVYGPWGRPDMALFLFTKKILAGEQIEVFNYGDMQRDFTFVDDIVEGVFRLINIIPQQKPATTRLTSDTSSVPYDIYNIGNGSPSQLSDYIKAIETNLGVKAEIKYMPIQLGDVPKSFSNTDKLFKATGFRPYTDINTGIKKFIDWYKTYYVS
jgi:UDP-glucuronate 4-epimerase